MAKIRYTIRLYRIHDLDLITFIETHEFNIVKAIYSSLGAFSKGEHFVIEVPPKRKSAMPNLKRVYQKPLYLDTDKDRNAIEILNKIEKGYRNNFLKNLLRLYLCVPVSESFLVNEHDSNFFYEKFNIFKKGKKVAKAGKLNNEKPHISKRKDNKVNVINTENKYINSEKDENDYYSSQIAPIKNEEYSKEFPDENDKSIRNKKSAKTEPSSASEELTDMFTNLFN